MLGIAKLYFLFAGFAVIKTLDHLLDEATLGDYMAVARLIAVPNMVIVFTLMFTVSRPLAAEFEQGSPSYFALRRRGFRMALLMGAESDAPADDDMSEEKLLRALMEAQGQG